jgi:hypothetical protein
LISRSGASRRFDQPVRRKPPVYQPVRRKPPVYQPVRRKPPV